MTVWVQQIWTALQPFHGEIISLIFTLIGTLLLYFFRSKVVLHFGRANNSRNVLFTPNAQKDKNATEIYVEKFFLQNAGRKAATNVEFVLSHSPNDITVWQPRDVDYKTVEKGNLLVKIPQIAPRELVIIDCLYINTRAAFVSSVKCAESMGKEVAFWTVRRFPSWLNIVVVTLILFGFAFTIQILISLFGS